MDRDEMVAILSGLAIDFETLMDLHNMDWTIFTYDRPPPWFFIDSYSLVKARREDGYAPGHLMVQEWDEHDERAAELRGRFLEIIEALKKASQEVT